MRSILMTWRSIPSTETGTRRPTRPSPAFGRSSEDFPRPKRGSYSSLSPVVLGPHFWDSRYVFFSFLSKFSLLNSFDEESV